VIATGCPLWVILDRSSGLCLPVDVRFAPKATEVLRCREIGRPRLAAFTLLRRDRIAQSPDY
jgi:hypothetical protein